MRVVYVYAYTTATKIATLMPFPDYSLTPNVTQKSPFGQISRTLAIPENPRTAAQMTVRDTLGRVAAKWRKLTETQRVQ